MRSYHRVAGSIGRAGNHCSRRLKIFSGLAGGVVQKQNTCLAGGRPWVRSSAPQELINESTPYNKEQDGEKTGSWARGSTQLVRVSRVASMKARVW